MGAGDAVKDGLSQKSLRSGSCVLGNDLFHSAVIPAISGSQVHVDSGMEWLTL